MENKKLHLTKHTSDPVSRLYLALLWFSHGQIKENKPLAWKWFISSYPLGKLNFSPAKDGCTRNALTQTLGLSLLLGLCALSILQTYLQVQLLSLFFLFFPSHFFPLHVFFKFRKSNVQLEAELKHCSREICEVSAYVSSKWGNHYHLSNCHRDLYRTARSLWFNSFTWYLEAIYFQQLAVKQTTAATVVQVATFIITLVCQPSNRLP